MKPIVYDLFCGLGGWSEGFLAEGYECIGFDIEAHRYPKVISTQSDAVKRPGMNWSDRSLKGSKDAQFNRPPDLDPEGGWMEYPGKLILRDIRSIHGSELKDAAVIVASPPCQAYSYRAMPWKRAKALPPPDNTLFNECFRIQREAIEAAGHHIPLIVENVRGAQKWVGRARWNYGSFYLWGDVPALMPHTFKGYKLPGNDAPRLWSEREVTRLCDAGKDTFGWSKESPLRSNGSHSKARKAASAMIAKIPFPLANWIAKAYKPKAEAIA